MFKNIECYEKISCFTFPQTSKQTILLVSLLNF